MNRSDLIDYIANHFPQLPHSTVAQYVRVICDNMCKKLLNDNYNRIEIRNFGTFSLVERKAITARNPKTGELLSLDNRLCLKFKPGKKLKSDLMNIVPKEKISN